MIRLYDLSFVDLQIRFYSRFIDTTSDSVCVTFHVRLCVLFCSHCATTCADHPARPARMTGRSRCCPAIASLLCNGHRVRRGLSPSPAAATTIAQSPQTSPVDALRAQTLLLRRALGRGRSLTSWAALILVVVEVGIEVGVEVGVEVGAEAGAEVGVWVADEALCLWTRAATASLCSDACPTTERVREQPNDHSSNGSRSRTPLSYASYHSGSGGWGAHASDRSWSAQESNPGGISDPSVYGSDCSGSSSRSGMRAHAVTSAAERVRD